LLQNLLISDIHWRRLLKLFQKGVSVTAEALKKAWIWIKKLRAFLAYDYGQIEIRILAHMSGDKKLLEAVESGDIHSTVGHELTGWSIDDIKNDKDIRTMIKNLHFGIVYGMSKPSLFASLRAKGVKISRSESDELHDKYFATYSGVRAFVNDIRNFAERHGYVETIFGFRRPIYVRDEDSDRESFWGNQAINSPIQGSAHQLLLIALAILRTMKRTYSALQEPVLEIHDALVFFDALEVLKEGQYQGLELLTKEVPRYIERVFKFSLKVPLVAEAKVGFRLGNMTEYEGGSVLQFIRKWVKSDYEVEKKIDTAWRKAA
jgi:DNA polymerase-1